MSNLFVLDDSDGNEDWNHGLKIDSFLESIELEMENSSGDKQDTPVQPNQEKPREGSELQEAKTGNISICQTNSSQFNGAAFRKVFGWS